MKITAWIVLAVALGLFAVSLALPGIVFHPNDLFDGTTDNTSILCSGPNNFICSQQSAHEIVCGEREYLPSDVDQSNILSPDAISQFCANLGKPSQDGYHYTAYTGEILMGWQILLSGLFEFILVVPVVTNLAVLAWLANVTAVFAIIATLAKFYKASLYVGLFTPLLGLSAFTLRAVDTGYPEIQRLIYVDHLAIGFYAWEVSLLCVALYCTLMYLAAQKPPAPSVGGNT